MLVWSPLLFVIYCAWAIFLSDADERLLLTPVALSAVMISIMIERFWLRDRHIPIADVGVVCSIITLTYAAMPTIFYLKSGLVWTELSDLRLVEMRTTPEDVAGILWLVTAYLAAFCLSYGLLRGKGMPGPELKISVQANHGWALLIIVVFIFLYQATIERIFNIGLNPSNEALQDSYGLQQLPLFIAQMTHNLLGIGRIAELGLIAFVLLQRKWFTSCLLMVWLAAEVYFTLSTLGARTYLAMLILALVLSYHRLVKSIGVVSAAGVALAFLAALIGYGYLRDLGRGSSLDNVWSAANEFQVLMANGLHARWAYDRGIIPEVPWAIKLSDLIMLFPQQVLPFQKLDPSDWYVDQIGAAGNGVGLMFGVIAQAQLGFGLPEIVVRGALLGSILALVHRICVGGAASLVAFVIYLWVCVSVYYTYRATTFYISVYAVYRVLPFVCMFCVLSWLLGTLRRNISERAA